MCRCSFANTFVVLINCKYHRNLANLPCPRTENWFGLVNRPSGPTRPVKIWQPWSSLTSGQSCELGLTINSGWPSSNFVIVIHIQSKSKSFDFTTTRWTRIDWIGLDLFNDTHPSGHISRRLALIQPSFHNFPRTLLEPMTWQLKEVFPYSEISMCSHNDIVLLLCLPHQLCWTRPPTEWSILGSRL